jgi:seryl-tRNA synthetase
MTLTTHTRELHALRRRRKRLIRTIERNGHRGPKWALGYLAQCEQIKQRIREIERGR